MQGWEWAQCTQNVPNMVVFKPTFELKRIGNKYSRDAYLEEGKNCSDNERPIKRHACVFTNLSCVLHMGKMFGTMKNHLVADVDSNYEIVRGGFVCPYAKID